MMVRKRFVGARGEQRQLIHRQLTVTVTMALKRKVCRAAPRRAAPRRAAPRRASNSDLGSADDLFFLLLAGTHDDSQTCSQTCVR